MNNFKRLQKILFSRINDLDKVKSLFVVNSATDFVRDRKLPFTEVIKFIVSIEAGALKDELLKYFDYSLDTPSVSAFVQARGKIKIDAFEKLFSTFNNSSEKLKTYKGYRLLAIDGSVVPIDNSIADKETTLIKVNQSDKPFSAYHINACFDLLESTYTDVLIQGQNEMDENDAFCLFVERYYGDKAIFIADRGYESYNGFEHVARSGNKYLIRVKDIHSKTSITKSLGPFEDGEFDIDAERILTKKGTKEILNNPQKYKIVPNNMRFDFMSRENPYYEFKCRIVRFKISENTYECIITNLSRDEFSVEEIKELYNKRWGIETSFRQVKYAIGLNAFHSKKRMHIKQEIYARLILHNFVQRAVNDISIPDRKRQYLYQINFTRSVHIVREFIKKTSGNPPVDNLIAKEILPVRPGRSNERNLNPKKAVYFNYRFD